MIGSVIHVNREEKIRIRTVVFGHPMVGATSTVTLISMGKEIKRIESGNIEQDSLTLELTTTVIESKWFAIHVKAHNGSFAHSSPI